MFPLLIMAGVSAAMSAAGSASSTSGSNKSASKNYMAQLEVMSATNEQIREANLQNTIRTGYRVGILNAQRGAAKAELVKQGYGISAKYQQLMGANDANAAAAGTVGSSVDAVSDDIQRKTEEANLAVQDQFGISNFNFDLQLNDIIQAGQDALQTPHKIPNQPTYANATSAALSSAAQSLISYGTNYAMSNMSLGLGKAPGATNVRPVLGG